MTTDVSQSTSADLDLGFPVKDDAQTDGISIEVIADVSESYEQCPIVDPTDQSSESVTTDAPQPSDGVVLESLPSQSLAEPASFKLLSSDELRALPKFEWRIKGVLPSQGLAVMFGPSGSGKSFLVLDMVHSIAAGHDWFGHKSMPCGLTYVALEAQGGIGKRVQAYEVQNGKIPNNVRYITQPFNLLKANDINALATAVTTAGTGDVVVLDTLSCAAPGKDENDSKDMSNIVSSAKILQDLIGGLVLLIHHTGKDASRGMRGHSSLHAALDSVVEVRRHADQREWIVAKNKDGEDGASYPFTLESVSLGFDSDGEEETSCVISKSQAVQIPVRKIPINGTNRRTAFETLEGALTANRVGGDSVGSDHPSHVLYEQAIDLVTPQMPGDLKHKKQRAKEAIDGLIKSKVVSLVGDQISINSCSR